MTPAVTMAITTPITTPPCRTEDIDPQEEKDAEEDHHRARDSSKEARTEGLDQQEGSAEQDQEPSEGRSTTMYDDWGRTQKVY